MRFWRIEDFDAYEAEKGPTQDDELRRLVDLLPPQQRHLISRTVFGGAFLSVAARELGLEKRAARQLRDDALVQLREWLEDPPGEDPPLEITAPQDAPLIWQCSAESWWGQCMQPTALASGVCAAHQEWAERGITPDPDYERAIVEGRKEPIQARLSTSEMDALTHGRYRGDGRRLDTYTTSDPLTDVWEVDDGHHG